MLTELARREKAANIKPDHDIDVYMKVRLLQITKSILCFKNSIYASIKQEGLGLNVDSHIICITSYLFICILVTATYLTINFCRPQLWVGKNPVLLRTTH
jgi:hypothetical protein